MALAAAFCDNPAPSTAAGFPMHIHILGICGTFMGSLAVLARQLGHTVSGSDQNVYPPMSTQLEQQGIALNNGYLAADIEAAKPDLVVIGNACSRGNPAVEYVLDKGLPFMSGPAWLAQFVLRERWVLAVAGTHGKTTTSSMLTWILEHAGYAPGYLIGGVPQNFPVSARLGESSFFVIEADEYDSAFFDKRSKFVHYLPRTAILGNLEFDHADIFRNLEDIQLQFHHLVKTIPSSGLLIVPVAEPNLDAVLDKGVYSELQRFAFSGEGDGAGQADWLVTPLAADGSRLRISHGADSADLDWTLLGRHNMQNAIAAVAAAAHVGVPLAVSCEALSAFAGVKRRLELLGDVGGIRLYDDFAHHPTAIRSTLAGLRARLQAAGDSGRLIAVIEARSNTMKMGYHQATLAAALEPADAVLWYRSAASRLDLEALARETTPRFVSLDDTAEMIAWLCREARAGDHVVIMSNGGFDDLHQRLLRALQDGSKP